MSMTMSVYTYAQHLPSPGNFRQRQIDIIYHFCSLKKRKDWRTSQLQPLHTCTDQYYQVCIWLCWYICKMGEPVSICDHDMVCSHRDLSTGSDHMNWTEASKLFHQTLQNLINGNAFVCTDLWGILQASRLWQDILTINNFLSCAVNHRSLSFLAIFTKGLITFLLKTVAQVGFVVVFCLLVIYSFTRQVVVLSLTVGMHINYLFKETFNLLKISYSKVSIYLKNLSISSERILILA